MCPGKAGEARYQPERSERSRGGHRKWPAPATRLEPAGGRAHGGHYLRGGGIELLAGVGQREGAMAAVKQGDAELVFQLLDLPAHRGLGEEQLLARLGERQVPGGGLEALQQVQARYHIPISHARVENLPFERGLRRMHSTHAK